MSSLYFLANTIVVVLSYIFILRAWFQFCRIDFYNPYSQSLAKITTPIIKPLSAILPTVGRINLSCLFVVFILGFLLEPLRQILIKGWFPIIEDLDVYLIMGVLHLIKTFGKALFFALMISAILSWFSQQLNPLQIILYQLTDPILKPIRRLLPNTGMIDFSPMVLAFILIFLNNLLYDFFGEFWMHLS